jgi:hypothetical protein
VKTVEEELKKIKDGKEEEGKGEQGGPHRKGLASSL